MALRELPCPARIVDDLGGAFSMGCVAGCFIHFIRGCWYSPRKERLFGGILMMKKRAPVLGGSFVCYIYIKFMLNYTQFTLNIYLYLLLGIMGWHI